jgi:hypothetical protein
VVQVGTDRRHAGTVRGSRPWYLRQPPETVPTPTGALGGSVGSGPYAMANPPTFMTGPKE